MYMYARGTINRNGKHHWPNCKGKTNYEMHYESCTWLLYVHKKYKYGSIFSHWSVVYIGREYKRNNWRHVRIRTTTLK